jgi:hypothetical protein
MYNMMVQASAMIGANIYVESDSPRYFKANKGLIGVIVFNLVSKGNGRRRLVLNALQVILYPGTYFYYRWRNAQKAKKWDALSAEQRKEYLDTTTDVGNKR